jgi:hypothetical protein
MTSSVPIKVSAEPPARRRYPFEEQFRGTIMPSNICYPDLAAAPE